MKIRTVSGFALHTFAVYHFTCSFCIYSQNGGFFVTTKVKCCFLLRNQNIFSVFDKRNQQRFDLN